MASKKIISFIASTIILTSICQCEKATITRGSQYQYVVFPLMDEFFNNGAPANNFDELVENAIRALIAKIGTVGTGNRKLAFILAIPIWDTVNYQAAKQLVEASVKASINTDAAIYFFVPGESTGWAGRPEFWNYSDPTGSGYNALNRNNVEWSDWNGTPYPHEYRDWGTPEELPPTMCYNCPAIRSEISKAINTRVAPVINDAIKKFSDVGKIYLFAGVTMGDEQTLWNYTYVDLVDVALGAFMTQHGASKIAIGYNALTQNGYSFNSQPKNFASAIAQVNHDFVNYCCMLLNSTGIPSSKIYTHIAAANGYAGTTSLRFSNAPLSTAFNHYSTPGFTTYITGNPTNDLSLIYAELAKQNITNWASTEANPNISGAISPSDYLKMHFDHGASVMVLNAGATSASLSNKLYKGVFGANAVNAYEAFLSNK